MEGIKELKVKIEEERLKLDQLAQNGDFEATYRQSLVVDALIEQYLDIADKKTA